MSKDNNNNDLLERSLLFDGWQVKSREIDLDYFINKIQTQPWKIVNQSFNAISAIADVLGNKNRHPLANVFCLLNEKVTNSVNDLWKEITPSNESFNAVFSNGYILNFSEEDLIKSSYKRDNFDIIEAQLSKDIITKITSEMGKPISIIQPVIDTLYEYDVNKFTNVTSLKCYTNIIINWGDVFFTSKKEHDYKGEYHKWSLYSNDPNKIKSLITKHLSPFSVYCSKSNYEIGDLNVNHKLESYTFATDLVAQLDNDIANKERFSLLVYGAPGTAKTSFCLAYAKEKLLTKGYNVFILDHEMFMEFRPPEYMDKVCIILNEVDTLAMNRSVYNNNNKDTEAVLGLLDGTSYTAIKSNNNVSKKMVTLMTCNTTDKLDKAFLRKGRIDLDVEFTTTFV